MEKELMFGILGIEETKEEAAIQAAYRTLLKNTNPEDDPEGFRRLREAYEGAIACARQPEETPLSGKPDQEKTEVERWLDQVKKVYEDMEERRDSAVWEELLADPVCEELDTAMDAGEQTLVFLMDHIELPHKIWAMLDQKFGWMEDQQELLEKFPKNFLDYVFYYIQNDTFIRYEYFEVKDREKQNGDGWLNQYYQVKRAIDQRDYDRAEEELAQEAGEQEKQKKQMKQKRVREYLEELDQLTLFGLYHPYADVERVRCYLVLDRMEADREAAVPGEKTLAGAGAMPEAAESGMALRHALALADVLFTNYRDDPYILSWSAEVFEKDGRADEAYQLWLQVLKSYPQYYIAKMGCIRHEMEKKEYESAKERLHQILDLDGRNEEAQKLLTECNNRLEEIYRAFLKAAETGEAGTGTAGDEIGVGAGARTVDHTAAGILTESGGAHLTPRSARLELAWCLFQNERLDEAIALVESWPEEEKEGYDYYNLFGRLLYHARQYERAKPLLEQWLSGIQATVDDGTEKTRRQIARRSNALYFLGHCSHELGRDEEAEEYLRFAADVAEKPAERLGALSYLAHMLFELKRYRQAVDACDQVLAEDERYYPALLTRQEANYEIRNGQQVVDDYHRAVEIYGGYFKPYLLAAKVFFYYEQYEDAKGVLERARENQVAFSDQMRLYEVKILRNLAGSEEDRKEALRLITALAAEPAAKEREEADLTDWSEVSFETGLLHWDCDENETAVSCLDRALSENPERLQYYLVRGNIRLEMKRYQQALSDYANASPDYQEAPVLYYNRGLCYEAQGMERLAIEDFEKVISLQGVYRDACEKVMKYYKKQYQTYFRRADLEKAVACMDRQMEAGESVYYLVERGLLYMNCFELDKAITDFERAIELCPDDWAAHNNIGCCYKYKGEFEKGIEELQKAADCMTDDNKSVLPYSNMADCYEALERYEEAADCYERDLALFPDWNSLYDDLGNLYAYLGDEEKAMNAYKKLEEKGEISANRAYLHQRKGNHLRALFWRKVSQWETEKTDGAKRWEKIADIYTEWNPKTAVFWLKAALRHIDPSASRYRESCELSLARQYYLLGKKKEAKIHAERYMEQFKLEYKGVTLEDYLAYGSYAPARFLNLAWYYIALGEKEKGREYIDRAGQITRCRQCRRRECYEKYYFRGLFKETEGDLAGAMEDYRKGKEVNPEEELFDKLIAGLERRMGRKK